MVILFIIILVIRPDFMIVQCQYVYTIPCKICIPSCATAIPTWATLSKQGLKHWFSVVKKTIQFIGWRDFLGEKRASVSCAKLFETPIPKFHFEMLLFNLAQGLRKLLHTNFVSTVFGACTRLGGNVFVDFLKLKMKRHSFLWLGKKHLLPFWGPQQKFFNI